MVVGAPVGSDAFCRKAAGGRREEEERVISTYHSLHTLQARWLLLFWCGTSRSTYLLRSLPPYLSAEFSLNRDLSLCGHLADLLSLPSEKRPSSLACLQSPLWQQAFLPLKWGGMGLRSAVRTAPAAYLGSWADALPTMGRQRWFDPSILILDDLAPPCVEALSDAAAVVSAAGLSLPSWSELTHPTSPASSPPPRERLPDPAGRKFGWQRAGSSLLDSLLFSSLLARCSGLDAARLKSLGGPGTSEWLFAPPNHTFCMVEDSHWLCQVSRRLGLAIPGLDGLCEKPSCGSPLDPLGNHILTCPGPQRIHRRHDKLRDVWGTLCREAGARVILERRLQAGPVALDPELPGGRRTDLVVTGSHLCQGLPVWCDVVVSSPISLKGEVHSGYTPEGPPNWRAEQAAQGKRRTYRDLATSSRIRFFPLAVDTFGCWGKDASSLISALAHHASGGAVGPNRTPLQAARVKWWWRTLSFATQRALATCVLAPPKADNPDFPYGDLPGSLPCQGELLVDRPCDCV